MKKLIIPLIITAAIAMSSLFSGCYSDTVDSISKFPFQLIINFNSDHYDRAAPDTSWDFTNLHKYSAYTENKDKIISSEILSFNYWINNLTTEDGVYDSTKHDIQFEFVKFYLQFAKTKNPGTPEELLDESHWERDPTSAIYHLGTFENVDVKDYFRYAHNIREVPEDVAKVISEALKERPAFYILTEYSMVKGQTEPKYIFPYVEGRYDLDIRFEVDLFK